MEFHALSLAELNQHWPTLNESPYEQRPQWGQIYVLDSYSVLITWANYPHAANPSNNKPQEGLTSPWIPF